MWSILRIRQRNVASTSFSRANNHLSLLVINTLSNTKVIFHQHISSTAFKDCSYPALRIFSSFHSLIIAHFFDVFYYLNCLKNNLLYFTTKNRINNIYHFVQNVKRLLFLTLKTKKCHSEKVLRKERKKERVKAGPWYIQHTATAVCVT